MIMADVTHYSIAAAVLSEFSHTVVRCSNRSRTHETVFKPYYTRQHDAVNSRGCGDPAATVMVHAPGCGTLRSLSSAAQCH